MRYSKTDIDRFLSRPMGLVAEFKGEVTFAKELTKEIDPDKAFEKGKYPHVVFSNGKALVPDPIENKRVWKLRK
jgi:hypothetical protein